MKANNKFRTNKDAYAQVVGGVVALLLTIVIGILVYWYISPAIAPASDSQTFTGYTLPVGADSQGTNSSAWSITLKNLPSSSALTNVTCYNATGGNLSYPTFTLANTVVSVAAGAAEGFSQVNVSWTTKVSTEAASTNTMAGTVFGLLPIIAIVAIGGILIGLVMVFGGSRGSGGSRRKFTGRRHKK